MFANDNLYVKTFGHRASSLKNENEISLFALKKVTKIIYFIYLVNLKHSEVNLADVCTHNKNNVLEI